MDDIATGFLYASFITLLGGAASLGWWSIRSRNALSALRRYPVSVQVRLTLPWPASWEPHVDREDIPAFRLLRRGLVRYYQFFLLPVFIFGVAATSLSYYEFLKAKADLAATELQIRVLRAKGHSANH